MFKSSKFKRFFYVFKFLQRLNYNKLQILYLVFYILISTANGIYFYLKKYLEFRNHRWGLTTDFNILQLLHLVFYI
jgi:hypothetical protein